MRYYGLSFIHYICRNTFLIKQNKTFKNILIYVNNNEHKISQYTDDTWLALDVSPKSLFETLEIIDFYSILSWPKNNTFKI